MDSLKEKESKSAPNGSETYFRGCRIGCQTQTQTWGLKGVKKNTETQKYLQKIVPNCLFYLVDFFKHIRKHAFTQTSKTPRTFSFYTSTGEVKPHVTLDGWARHSAPGLSLVNHKLNNFCMYSLDTICTEGYYFTQRAIGHIQFLTQPWCQLILGVVREIIIGI